MRRFRLDGARSQCRCKPLCHEVFEVSNPIPCEAEATGVRVTTACQQDPLLACGANRRADVEVQGRPA